MKAILKLFTFDTNCFFDLFERNSDCIERLFEYAESGKIDIVKTTRVLNDTLDKWKGEGVSPIWLKINEIPNMRTIGSGFRLDYSRLNSPDVLGSEEQTQLASKIEKVMPEAQVEDRDHLLAHMINKRDVFVTSDKHFLDNSLQIERILGVIVMRPEEAIRFLQDK